MLIRKEIMSRHSSFDLIGRFKWIFFLEHDSNLGVALQLKNTFILLQPFGMIFFARKTEIWGGTRVDE